jgi:glycosyltransferase involved in cell wall biosynthesis
MPAISVVIPTYNSSSTLAETLASVRDQTCQDFEVVLSDDGSSDDTVRTAERFARSLDLSILQQTNAGPGAARNAGIRAARGRYCAFVDADDLMLPERLAQQVALLDADPELGLVHTDLMTFDDRGTIHATRHVFSNPCGGWILERLLLENFITTSTVMAPTARLVEAGLFNEQRRISEDFELWLRVAERYRVGFIDRPLVRYRRRPGSLSDDKLITGLAALDVIEQFWRTHAEYGKQHSSLRHRSLSRHLSTAGSAALDRRNGLAALGFVLRSLRYDAGSMAAWKQLARVALAPIRGRLRSARA